MAMTKMSADALTPEMKERATRTVFLICVSRKNEEVKSGHNKYYNMYIIDGDLWVEYGRVDHTRIVEKGSGHLFDSKYRSKTRKRSGRTSYDDVTHLKEGATATSTPSGSFAAIKNSAVASIIDKLMRASNQTVQQSYTVAVDVVTQTMIDEAQAHIDWIAKNLGNSGLNSLNDRLLELYKVLPRKIASVELSLLTNDLTHNQSRLADEQVILDSMRGAVVQVNSGSGAKPKGNTILDSIGITMEEASADELSAITKKAQDALQSAHWTSDIYSITRAFKVSNPTTEAAMKSFVSGRPNKKTRILWHGSRDENWLSILKSGLLIRPAGARTTGAMYGYGVYFSRLARKSLGYCSLRGSYWASGSSNKGIIALYEVHTGKHYEDNYGSSSHSWDALQRRGNYDSVYAPAGAATINDERIVYRPEQSTIRYLVEFKI